MSNKYYRLNDGTNNGEEAQIFLTDSDADRKKAERVAEILSGPNLGVLDTATLRRQMPIEVVDYDELSQEEREVVAALLFAAFRKSAVEALESIRNSDDVAYAAMVDETRLANEVVEKCLRPRFDKWYAEGRRAGILMDASAASTAGASAVGLWHLQAIENRRKESLLEVAQLLAVPQSVLQDHLKKLELGYPQCGPAILALKSLCGTSDQSFAAICFRLGLSERTLDRQARLEKRLMSLRSEWPRNWKESESFCLELVRIQDDSALKKFLGELAEKHKDAQPSAKGLKEEIDDAIAKGVLEKPRMGAKADPLGRARIHLKGLWDIVRERNPNALEALILKKALDVLESPLTVNKQVVNQPVVSEVSP